jgi:Ring finger domain
MSLFHNRFVSVNIDSNNDNKDEQDKTCTVCYSNMDDVFNTTLKCGHSYHTDCYTSYIAYNVAHKKESINCPVCRNNILEITVNKPEVTRTDNDVENQSGYDNDDDDTQQTCCTPSTLCARLLKVITIVGTIYFVSHLTIFCTHSHSC